MSINRETDNKNVANITMEFYSAIEKNETCRKMDRSRQYNINKLTITQNKLILFLSKTYPTVYIHKRRKT